MGEPTYKGMQCPRCSYCGSATVDSRAKGEYRRRRHECERCKARFTTYEITEQRYTELTGLEFDLDQVNTARVALGRIEKNLRKTK